jgi:cobalamin-dependent methionine synthase I
VHGIGVQLTEALTEYWHGRVGEESKYTDHAMAAEDPDSVEEYLSSATAEPGSRSFTARAPISRIVRR